MNKCLGANSWLLCGPKCVKRCVPRLPAISRNHPLSYPFSCWGSCYSCQVLRNLYVNFSHHVWGWVRFVPTEWNSASCTMEYHAVIGEHLTWWNLWMFNSFQRCSTNTWYIYIYVKLYIYTGNFNEFHVCSRGHFRKAQLWNAVAVFFTIWPLPSGCVPAANSGRWVSPIPILGAEAQWYLPFWGPRQSVTADWFPVPICF